MVNQSIRMRYHRFLSELISDGGKPVKYFMKIHNNNEQVMSPEIVKFLKTFVLYDKNHAEKNYAERNS